MRECMKIYIDVTNLMTVDFLTGIQRVVREVLVRLLKYDDFEMVLLEYCQSVGVFKELDTVKFYNYFKENNGQKDNIKLDKEIDVKEMKSGSIFLEIDSVWNSPYRRSKLLPLIKDRGLKIVSYIYDIIPIMHPQYFNTSVLYNFMDYFGACIQYADAFIVSTQSVLDNINEVVDQIGIPRIPGYVSWLGSDFIIRPAENMICSEVNRLIMLKKKYVLIVGTVEPRKNHKILLDAFEKELFAKDVCLVIAGKIGWNVEALERRIRNNPYLGKKLFFFEGLNDANVNLLYKNAFFVAFPTYDEGFGLPMIEAFERGVPVIASDCRVLREVGGELAVYFQTESEESFSETLNVYIDNPAEYQAVKRRLGQFVPPTWDQTTEKIAAVLKSFEDKTDSVVNDVKQMVVLSARCQDLCETLPYIEQFMPFIQELILCCPDEMNVEFLKKYSGGLKYVIITDSMLVGECQLPIDHQERNFYLRSLVMKRDELDSVFIMSDDDYRPLVQIDQCVFVKDGKYQAYYCHSLRTWKGTAGNQTSYDQGMFNTLKFLEKYHYPVLQYSSHMPQIIDKKKYQEFLELHEGIERLGVDEWSSYFNWLQSTYPGIVEPLPYVTMCWPASPTDWKLEVIPPKFLFENYYKKLYKEGEIFAGFSSIYNDGLALENEKKMKLFAMQQNLFLRYELVFEKYKSIYMKKNREIPSFIFAVGKAIEIYLPCYIILPFKGFVRLPVIIYKGSEYGEQQIRISYFLEQKGLTLLSAKDIICVDVSKTMEIEIPLFSTVDKRGKMLFSISVEYKGKRYSNRIKAIIVDTDEFLSSENMVEV